MDVTAFHLAGLDGTLQSCLADFNDLYSVTKHPNRCRRKGRQIVATVAVVTYVHLKTEC